MNTLTANQTLLLNAIITDNYHDSGSGTEAVVGNWTYTFSVCDTLAAKGVSRKSMGGIIAQAQEAGLVKCDDSDDDECISITRKGWDAVKG